MPKAQETILEINLNALASNYHYLKSKLHPETIFLAVVKAFAYGSDSQIVANKLQELGADYFAVAYTQEGINLRQAGITKPILVLHPQEVNYQKLIDNCLEPNLYSLKSLKRFVQIATSLGQKHYPVHIKFNTGLNRLGFLANQTGLVTQLIASTNAIKVKSVFSHLAASEDANESEFTLKQISDFRKIANHFSDKIGYNPWLHICNTSGILNYPDAHFNMVRSGIGLYGFDNANNKNLQPITSLKTIISQIHTLKKGETLGYNRAFKAPKTTRVATLPIGHADGISRQYGNEKGYVIINLQKAPIIGNVCMDMIMVNVNEISCTEGDEVILFNTAFTAEHFANQAKTISYEILTAISQRVKRVIIS